MKQTYRLFVVILPMMLACLAVGEDATDFNASSFGSNLKTVDEFMSTAPAYRNAALDLTIREANSVANELQLQDVLPITETNLVSYYIPPPRLAQRLGAIGNLTTSNYSYYFSVGNKFSFLTRVGLDRVYDKLQKQYLWPRSRMDTNSAYQLAVRWLSEASMDVQGLNRDCTIHILAFTPEGDQGQHFVPVYWVYWSKPDQEGHGSTASIELLEPTKTLLQLRVEDTQYILRKPLQFTNLDLLLSTRVADPSKE